MFLNSQTYLLLSKMPPSHSQVLDQEPFVDDISKITTITVFIDTLYINLFLRPNLKVYFYTNK